MTDSLVSIVIPCHNAARWLAATLESAFAQSWRNIEVILVDDGSTDGSAGIAAGYEARGLRIFRQENRGASAARNAGLRAAKGEFIQFLDADDLLARDKIERQVTRLSSARDTCIASGAWGRFRDSPDEAAFALHPNWRDLSGIEFQQLAMEEGWMMHPAAWLAPRRLVDAAGPWDESLSLNDDGEYFARVMLAAEGIVFCGGARSYYRSGIAGGSLSGRTDGRSLDSLFRSVELTIQHLRKADGSARTIAACANAWKGVAFAVYPGLPELSREAEARSEALGGSSRPFQAGGRFQLASRVFGWRIAKRLFC